MHLVFMDALCSLLQRTVNCFSGLHPHERRMAAFYAQGINNLAAQWEALQSGAAEPMAVSFATEKAQPGQSEGKK